MPEGAALADHEEKMKLGLHEEAAHPESYIHVAREETETAVAKEKTVEALHEERKMLAGFIFGLSVNIGIMIAGVVACLMTRSQDMKALQAAQTAKARRRQTPGLG